MLKTMVSATIMILFTLTSVLAFYKADNTSGKGGKKIMGAGMGKDGDKTGGGKPDKSLDMQGLAMGKDGGDKGEGTGGGDKGVVDPIDNAILRGRPGLSRNQMNRSIRHGNASADRGMERGMERNVEGISR